jgi:hypothetical protein
MTGVPDGAPGSLHFHTMVAHPNDEPLAWPESLSKRAILVSATAGFVLGSLVAAAPARAESKSAQVDQMTCEAFLAMKPDEQQRMASWVDGYQTAKGDAADGVVAFDTCGKPIGALVDECTMAPKETLWQKLKKRLSIGPRDPGTRCVGCIMRTGVCRCPLSCASRTLPRDRRCVHREAL